MYFSNLQMYTFPDLSTGFHTYGVDWEPDFITWYLDGVRVTMAGTPPPMNEPMITLVTLAVGGAGSWPGPPTSAAEFPAQMQVDCVRAYATADTKYVSGTAAIGLGAPLGKGSVTGIVAVGLGTSGALAGIAVSLLDARGGIVGSTNTDTRGHYQFTYITPGAYTVSVAPPSGYASAPGATGAASVTVTSGGASLASTFTLLVSNTITGSVWLGNAAAAGVAVALLDSAGTSALATTTTNAGGAFTFSDVVAGDYAVRYTARTGEALSMGPASTTTGLTGTVTVVNGQTVTLAP